MSTSRTKNNENETFVRDGDDDVHINDVFNSVENDNQDNGINNENFDSLIDVEDVNQLVYNDVNNNDNNDDESDNDDNAINAIYSEVKDFKNEWVDDNDERADDEKIEMCDLFGTAFYENKSVDFIMALIDLFPVIVKLADSNGDYPLHMACYRIQYKTVIMKLVELYPIAAQHPNAGGEYPLHIVCSYNQDDEVVIKLIDIYPLAAQKMLINDSESNEAFALHLACSYDQSENVIIKLIEATPNALFEKDSQGNYPIHLAVSHYPLSLSVVKVLIDAYPSLIQLRNSNGDSVLHRACERNNIPLIEYLLRHPDILVNTKDGDGMTPLYIACECDKTHVVERLLSHPDIDVNIRDSRSGCTPLHIASSSIVVGQLLDHPCILINEKNDSNQSPLEVFKIKIGRYKWVKPYDLRTDVLSNCVRNIIRRHIVPSKESIKLLEEFQTTLACILLFFESMQYESIRQLTLQHTHFCMESAVLSEYSMLYSLTFNFV